MRPSKHRRLVQNNTPHVAGAGINSTRREPSTFELREGGFVNNLNSKSPERLHKPASNTRVNLVEARRKKPGDDYSHMLGQFTAKSHPPADPLPPVTASLLLQTRQPLQNTTIGNNPVQRSYPGVSTSCTIPQAMPPLAMAASIVGTGTLPSQPATKQFLSSDVTQPSEPHLAPQNQSFTVLPSQGQRVGAVGQVAYGMQQDGYFQSPTHGHFTGYVHSSQRALYGSHQAHTYAQESAPSYTGTILPGPLQPIYQGYQSCSSYGPQLAQNSPYGVQIEADVSTDEMDAIYRGYKPSRSWGYAGRRMPSMPPPSWP